jgi:hypothetical protein
VRKKYAKQKQQGKQGGESAKSGAAAENGELREQRAEQKKSSGEDFWKGKRHHPLSFA